MHVRIRHQTIGLHVHVAVFAGRRADLTHAKAGDLVFRAEEWPDVRDLLFRHAEQVDAGRTEAGAVR